MNTKLAGKPICKKPLESFFHRSESNFIPGNIGFREQLRLDCFWAWVELVQVALAVPGLLQVYVM